MIVNDCFNDTPTYAPRTVKTIDYAIRELNVQPYRSDLERHLSLYLGKHGFRAKDGILAHRMCYGAVSQRNQRHIFSIDIEGGWFYIKQAFLDLRRAQIVYREIDTGFIINARETAAGLRFTSKKTPNLCRWHLVCNPDPEQTAQEPILLRETIADSLTTLQRLSQDNKVQAFMQASRRLKEQASETADHIEAVVDELLQLSPHEWDIVLQQRADSLALLNKLQDFLYRSLTFALAGPEIRR